MTCKRASFKTTESIAILETLFLILLNFKVSSHDSTAASVSNIAINR